MKILETDRLLLRDWELSDASDLFAYASLPSVGPNAGWAPHNNVDESLTVVRHFIEQNDTWAVVLKNENKVIGSVGLHKRMDITGKFVTELGYVLSTPYEGNGYMTEAVRRIIAYAFDELKTPLIKVYHFIDNHKSERVIEKCGFIFDQKLIYKTVINGEKLSKSYHLSIQDYYKTKGKQS